MIDVTSSHLAQLHGPDRDPVARAAPTGAAASGIAGSTLHSLLKLPVEKGRREDRFPPLSNAQAAALQRAFQHIRYLIIDEKSMVSLRVLWQINQRLKQAFSNDGPFGGINVLLFGDFWQLAPVLDKALFTPVTGISTGVPQPQEPQPHFTAQDRHAAELYKLLNKSIELTVQQRQDSTQVEFAEALTALRACNVGYQHWQTLSARCSVSNPLPCEIYFNRV